MGKGEKSQRLCGAVKGDGVQNVRRECGRGLHERRVDFVHLNLSLERSLMETEEEMVLWKMRSL